ncbi:MAG TPA: VOC family protein [Propioniciclava sp.]|jgi:catechol 2,3-dioxygenase|uniref:VOC family protein n=1 Tax=Propioniciclava sp. TaxID=2038686 RepID=UPI002CF6B23A|nr:VOC family protein [Propioniciclava sp.]HRL50713.1 VOC family protein [Propioniciclava sp.]HRL81210.1 VOC family protein [Propioniciclava sp.]
MTTTTLPATTHMGSVALDVADLDAMTTFYRDVLLLDQIAERGDEIDLGRGSDVLVTLRHRPGLPRGERRTAGLFHTAILHDSPTSLATTLASFALARPELYTGSGDHLVSQAFYLDDPEGNGVELYYDRPRDTWTWDNGQVRMTTLFVDPNQFLGEHLTPQARDFVETAAGRRGSLPDETVVGHVHLKVGDTARAKDFYVDTLGFDVTSEMRGALFVSAGGYHHHMAMNTWSSEGVGLRAPGLGLGRVDIVVPSAADVAELTTRARSRGVQIREEGGAVELDDPWGNLVRLSA